MDPVTIGRLLDCIEVFSAKAGISNTQFRRSLDITVKRRDEFLRLLKNIQMIEIVGSDIVTTQNLGRFLEAWKSADLVKMNECARVYRPYRNFLSFLENEKVLSIPYNEDKDDLKNQKKAMTARLKQQVKLNFAAFTIFQGWALALGCAHRSFQELFWGGNSPPYVEFETELRRNYERLRLPSGYAELGVVADEVSKNLFISIPKFEKLFQVFYERNRESIVTSSAVQKFASRSYQLKILNKRGDSERFRSWTVDDGIVTRWGNIKLIRM